jgi:hypothetical protein
MKSIPLSFSPALSCVVCKQLTTAGRIYTMNPLVWQLVPLCDEHSEEPVPTSGVVEEPFASASDLQWRITNDIRTIEQLRRKRQRVARAFLGLRKQGGHTKAKRALRRKLRCICQRQAEEV